MIEYSNNSLQLEIATTVSYTALQKLPFIYKEYVNAKSDNVIS